MFITISLIISIILQFISAIVAVSLIKRTKYNVAWILVSIGLVLMAIRRLLELLPFLKSENELIIDSISNWIGVIISIILFIGIFYIKRIFKSLEMLDQIRSKSEKKILRAIIKTEEKERKHFAKELHDGLGPLLSSIKMLISGLKQSNDETKQKKIIDNLEVVTNEAIISIKEISNLLSPHILNNFGLFSAVKSFNEKISETGTIKIVLNSNIQGIRFDFNTETILYRVICELINNTIKHASAKSINIDIFLENKILKIYYYDDGIGFDAEEILNKEDSGMGFSNILTRLNSINGTIKIESELNSGVNINITAEIQYYEKL